MRVPVFAIIFVALINIAHPPPPPDHPDIPDPEVPFAPAAVIVPTVKLKDSLTSINSTHPPAHPAAPDVDHPVPPPPPPQYHCRYHPKCDRPVHPAQPAPALSHAHPAAEVTTFITLCHADHMLPAPVQPAIPPAAPSQAIDIVPPLITNLPLHLITATHPFVGAPENVSVPPVIVIDE